MLSIFKDNIVISGNETGIKEEGQTCGFRLGCSPSSKPCDRDPVHDGYCKPGLVCIHSPNYGYGLCLLPGT